MKKNETMESKKPGPVVFSLVDVFSGIGGFTQGFMDDSVEPRFRFVPRLMADIDPAARQVAIRNLPAVPFLLRDIHQVSGSEIREAAGLKHDERLDVLVGGPPCQGFSFLGKRAIEDPRNALVMDFLRLVKEIRPLVAVIENVPLLITSHDGVVIREVCDGLSLLGYASCADILTASEYGVPQIRKRAFVLAYHKDLGVTPAFPPRTHERIPAANDLAGAKEKARFEENKLPYVSVQEAIGDLPSLRASEGEEVMAYPRCEALSAFQVCARKGSLAVFNHVSRAHSADFLKKISIIQEGGRNKDLPTGARFSDNYFSQAYARLNRDGIANTITTHFSNPGSGRFIHYQDVRSITVREAARLQSFPDTFIFSGELGAQMRHVGNAVPPLMARAIRDQIGRDLLLARSNRPAERLSDHKPDPPVVVSKERSRIMRAVPSRNTSAEIALRKALWAAGLRGFRTQARAVPGNPDIVFARQKVAIFVDGCFWHGCPKCYREPSTNKAYWQMKVQRNKSRDEQVNKLCGQRGWRVIRIWEHAILSRPDAAAVRVARFLRGSKAVASRRHKKR